MADLFDFSQQQDDIDWNMSKETLKRINNFLILMGMHRYHGQLDQWRNACESLCNEISPFFKKLKDKDITNFNIAINKVNETQKRFIAIRDAGEYSTNVAARFMAALTNYDRLLRRFSDDVGIYISKGDDARFVMDKQFK